MLKKMGLISKTIIIEGGKSVAMGAGIAVVIGVAKGNVKSLKDITLKELLK